MSTAQHGHDGNQIVWVDLLLTMVQVRVQSNLAIPELDNTDTSLSCMKCYEFTKFSQQSLTCCPGSLVVPDRFFGFWSSGITRCDCTVLSL